MTLTSSLFITPAQPPTLPLPASPGRGEVYHGIATRFIESYPIGTYLSNYAFDEWAEQQGLLPVVSEQDRQNKDSDGWNARLMRRNALRKKINKAADHPRMDAD